jgi:hypothetical protein
MYFTPDWDEARTSVRHLADYAPTAAITGHGPPMRGERLQSELRNLSSRFDEVARPAHGRYRDRPAVTDASGVVDVPPPVVSARTVALTGLAVGAVVGIAYLARHRRDDQARDILPSADIRRSADETVVADDASLALGTDLANADGGYDVTVTAAADAPSTVDLR